MERGWRALAVAVVLSLPIAGCRQAGQRDLLAVGTCVVSDEQGTRPVGCGEAHTHRVIAIAPRPEDCPSETTMASTPADPDDGTVTECFQSDASE
jgi:hypothetical protein